MLNVVADGAGLAAVAVAKHGSALARIAALPTAHFAKGNYYRLATVRRSLNPPIAAARARARVSVAEGILVAGPIPHVHMHASAHCLRPKRVRPNRVGSGLRCNPDALEVLS